MKNFIEYINLNPKIKIFLILFGLTNIISIMYYFLGQILIYILLLIIYILVFYILFKTQKFRKWSYLLFIIPAILILSGIIFRPESGPPFAIFLTLISILVIRTIFSYIAILFVLISIIYIHKKTLVYANIIFIFVIIIFVNIDIIYSIYDSYNKNITDTYSESNDDRFPCLSYIFSKSGMMDSGLPDTYRQSIKSHLLFPTLGIKYKETYEEEKGIVVVYEKHSYFNLYVGDGKVLFKSEGDLETLE